MAVEQYPLGAHGLLQVEAPFPMVVEPKEKNLPPPGADSKVAIFTWIPPNISFS
jgi:hypothetical protein